MFTLFNDTLDQFGRATLQEQRAFERGELPVQEVQAIQLERLRSTLRYVKANSPFYASRLAAWSDGMLAELDVHGFRKIPFTTKNDLRAAMYDVTSEPLDRAWVFYETTGTTGKATPCPRSARDSIVNNVALTVCYDSIFRSHGDRHVVAVMGPTELHSTGDTFGDVLRNLGHTVVKMWPHSPLVGIPRALHLLRELSVTAMVCTPGLAIALARAAAAAGLDPRRDFGARLILSLGELASPSMLSNLGGLWSARVYNCMYASQEASILASCRDDGLLHTIPLNNYYEVLLPDSNDPAPIEGGVQEGELAITHLYQGNKPLVRYRTGDLVRMTGARQGAYRSPVLTPIGRVRDRLSLAGRSVCALDLEEVLFGEVRDCLDYQIVIDRIADGDRLTIELEMVDGAAQRALDPKRVVEAVQRVVGVPVAIAFETLGGVTGTGAMVSWKAARIHDRRTAAPDSERAAALAIAQARAGR